MYFLQIQGQFWVFFNKMAKKSTVSLVKTIRLAAPDFCEGMVHSGFVRINHCQNDVIINLTDIKTGIKNLRFVHEACEYLLPLRIINSDATPACKSRHAVGKI